ncbi:D-alanyl-D-alanine carboxypeptidase/D-alanyl-D-alanine endopeptidase [Chryseobacterium phocaeense]|uniref:D-alanyl-D-alanine carboxypeptidase/D-alanyl-D-alanine endopeptidase n=1 Tax=Chryseobacterium phocaeense TaxID=1816690 RepID=UPI0009BB4B16|nr:D-alanyl-D-alanine carboxypeptidase/D-alanyl-D-alanine-endopeptidase [Chryseobacterium phocaeense]
MVNYRKYISGVAVLASGFFLAQSTVSTVLYSQAYDNQKNSLNLPSPITSVAERTVLSAKELVDINVNTMMADPVLKNASWGFVVYDPKTKKVISSYNENTPLVPASTTKLLTTETALNLLGENYRWMTQLEYSGTVDENGVLNGNLYVVGSGDPSLGTNKAGAWSYRDIISDFMSGLSREGIKKVNGDIIIQTALFKGNIAVLPENVVWLENNNYYLPVGTTREINPANEKLIVKKSGFSSDKKYFYVSPYVKQMVYAEKYDGDGFLTTKLPDAPAYLANSFRTTMVKSGIGVTGKVTPRMTDATPESRKLVAAYKSPTLGDIVFYTNQHSDNSLAEALLKTVGFQKMGDQTSESGRMVVTNHLREDSFDMIGLNYMDGSGLSRSNNVTPISQVKFLTSLMDEKYYKTYFTSLPVGGQSGTLKRMFIGTGNGQVFAKTGTLNKVKTLAGYLKTNSGKTLVFSLMVNNYSGSVDMVKKRMEKILEPALDL